MIGDEAFPKLSKTAEVVRMAPGRSAILKEVSLTAEGESTSSAWPVLLVGVGPEIVVAELRELPAPLSSSLQLDLDENHVGLDFDVIGVDSSPSQTPKPHTTLVLKAASPKSSAAINEYMGSLRKEQHLEICQKQDVEAQARFTGFSDLSFVPLALPELNWQDLDTTQEFLGRRFKAPLFITGMTGGIAKGAEINLILAKVAADFGIPFGVGSQRIAMGESLSDTDSKNYSNIFAVKDKIPDVFLIANLGMGQLRSGAGPSRALDSAKRAIDMIQADALAIHLNVLQEVIQVEGDREFSGVFHALESICRGTNIPVIVKEVGSGMDVGTARKLLDSGVRAIDTGGSGGTSWGYIEGLRAAGSAAFEVASAFRDWGIPTAHAVASLRQGLKRGFPHATLTATGGIRSGLDAAKALALGANMVGIGLPMFRAALNGHKEAHEVMGGFVAGLKTAMICVGASKLANLPRRLVRSRGFDDAVARILEVEVN